MATTAILEVLRWAQQSPYLVAAALASTLLVIAVAGAWFRPTNNSKGHKSPPSPPALPLIGNLHRLSGGARALASLVDRYGQLTMVRLGSVDCLVVTTTEAAREVMKAHDLSFSSRPRTKGGDAMLYSSRDIASNPYGENWRQVRRVTVLHLLTAARLRQLRGVREGEVAAMLRKIDAAAKGGDAINISTALLNIANSVTSIVALGKNYWSDGECKTTIVETGRMVRDHVEEFLRLVGSFNIADFMPRLAWVNWITGFDRRMAKCAQGIDEWLEREIKERLQIMEADGSAAEGGAGGQIDGSNNVGVNFLEVLLRLEAEGNHGYSLFDRDTIKAIILDMFAGGTHTTSTAMDWTMTELMRHPEVRAKLTKEVRSTCAGSKKALLLEEDIENAPYLRCVIKEILRLHPPFPLLAPRETIEDVTVMGYHIPKGTKTLINAWAIHHDPKNWDRPHEFLPERFADSPIDYKGFDFELIPFGSGRRGCPGMLFAMQITYLAIANILYHYDWELPDGMKTADLDMTEAQGLTTNRNYSLILKVKKAP